MGTMDMGSSAMAVLGATTIVATATTTMATATMALMDMGLMLMDMGLTPTALMDMGSMDMAGMNMAFSTTYNNYPVWFSGLKAASGGAAFGIFVLIFAVAFITRGLIFLSAYLEVKVFHAPNVLVTVEDEAECGCDDKGEVALVRASVFRQMLWTNATDARNDVVRLVLAFVIAMFGYALMLATMTFVVVYFFAVVTGLAFAELFWGRLGRVTGVNAANGTHAIH